MAEADITGRQYARSDAVRPGDTLIADGGFTCLHEGERCIVKKDSGGLFVFCNGPDEDGRPCGDLRYEHHYLDGQDDGDGFLVGLYPHAEPAP